MFSLYCIHKDICILMTHILVSFKTPCLLCSPPKKKDKNKTKQKNIWINTESIEKHRPCANLSNVCCPKGIPKFLPTPAHLSTPNGCQEKEEIFWKIKISNLGCGRSKGDL